MMKAAPTTRFRIQRYAVYGFMSFSVFASQWINPNRGFQEIFPFFDWNLHSTINNVHNFIQVRLSGLRGDSPCLLQNCRNVAGGSKTTRFYFIVQEMGRVRELDPAAFEELRSQLETILKQSVNQATRYELIEASAKPRDFANGGAVELGRVVYQGIVLP